MTRNRVAVLGLGLVIIAAPAGAAGIDGTGTVGTCPTAGKIGIKPPLVFAGTSPDTLKIGTKTPKLATCSGGTGDGAHVLSAKGKGGGPGMNNDCLGLQGTMSNTLTLTVKWKTDGAVKLNASTITITSETGGTSTTPPNHGQFDVTGTVTAGSFAGDNVTAHIVTDQDLNEILGACGAKGLKKITFGSKPSKDDLQMGSGSVTIN